MTDLPAPTIAPETWSSYVAKAKAAGTFTLPGTTCPCELCEARRTGDFSKFKEDGR